MAPRKAFRKPGALCIFTEAERRPRATATPRTGMRPANPAPTTTRISRTQRCSGITTMRWASIGSISMRVSSASTSSGTDQKSCNLPSGEFEIPLVIMDRDLRVDGQLSYPVSPNPERPWVPEAFGEAQLVNGKLYPFHEVQPRRYRLRILNAANGRFYRLSFSGKLQFHQIGSDQGLLSSPVQLKYVQLAPGERADLIVDFSSARGSHIQLESDPFVLMQFRVGSQPGDDPSSLPASLRTVTRLAEKSAILTRRLTLDENLNMVAESMGMLLNKTPWHAPITEKPALHSTEIWEFVNLTEDTHPIHLHMVRFQLLDRCRFDAFDYTNNNTLRYVSEPMPPDANEMGWKDTVRVNAKTVTRILVPFVGYAGRYVWHCHILEHEDNEMMRPYEIVGTTS